MQIAGKCLLLLLILSFVSCNNTQENRENSAAEKVVAESSKKENSGTRIILFFGNSLTAGMGLETDEAFPAIIQQKIDSLRLDYQVVNAGLSGETTAGGRNRISWVLDQQVDVFVLELGANDGLRGIDLAETRRNLQAIIDTARSKNPEMEIILAGMQIPPNMGQAYTSEFKQIFPGLAEENGVHLIPFLLEGVGGNPDLNQADGIHPTAEGQKILAQNVWEIIAPIIIEP